MFALEICLIRYYFKYLYYEQYFSVNQVAPKVKKVLQLFRLRQINNGIFIKLNKVRIQLYVISMNFLTFLLLLLGNIKYVENL